MGQNTEGVLKTHKRLNIKQIIKRFALKNKTEGYEIIVQILYLQIRKRNFAIKK
jgi:hypothetical protein